MEITSVKQMENGYLVNGSLSVPNDPANRHMQMVQEWLDAGNTPEDRFSTEELDAQLVAAIKSAASSQITTNLPEWKQRNMLARAAYLMNKETRTAEEDGEMADLETAWLWVENIRSTSNLAESAKTPVESISWPTPPAAVTGA